MDQTGSYVFDIETDGFDATKIHCLSIYNLKSKKKVTLTDYEQMRNFLLSARVLIGHNIVSFDIPVLERLLGIEVCSELIDTLWISRYAYPKRGRHSLESWGEDVGIPKPEVEEWENLPLEVYIHRCEEDVEINRLAWALQKKRLYDIYGSEEELLKFVRYLRFKSEMEHLQYVNKWKLDVEHVIRTKHELEAELNEKINTITPHMPNCPVYKTRIRPKNFYKKDGTFTARAIQWFDLAKEEGVDPIDTEVIKYISDYKVGNLGSTDQVKKWLFSLGWKPRTFKTSAKKVEVPQISLERGQGLCPSVKELFKIEPVLENLEGISILQHRIGILKGFLETVNEEGYVTAGFGGITNTLRYQHKKPCVNLPKVGLAYSDGIRASLIAGNDQLLCGSDLSGLEDRIKQHFIFFHDPEYVREMQREDYDPHLSLALHAEAITQKQYDGYVSGEDLTIKPIRDIFKNGNYACQYGAFPPRLAKTCGISLEEASSLHAAYWSKNSAITDTANGTTVKELGDGSMWQLNPINGFWYSLRSNKDRFSTLVQGTASFIFDIWCGFILQEQDCFIGQFHDEFILRIDKGQEEETEALIRNSLEKVNNYVNLNVDLDCDVQFGERYSDIH